MKRILPPLFLMCAIPACAVGKAKPLQVQTATVARRDITITADANGVIEPIVIVEIRSKAGGQLIKLNVDTGSPVDSGKVLAQVDTRDVQNRYDQAVGDLKAAQAQYDVAVAQKLRSDEMLKAKVITPQENEGYRLTFETTSSNLISQKANLDIAKQNLEDATVKALTRGTIIERDVSEGNIIQSSTTAAGGGTVLLKMADLTKVRMRAYFNETDIGLITPGEGATVTVDAYPDRRFIGKVEKIEPEAIVQQGVTMFPVLINLDNSDNALRPGMNGEVSALVDQRVNVLAITNDAIKTQREGPAIAPLLGISADSFNTMMRMQTARGRGQGGGGAGGANGGGGGAQQGEVDLAPKGTDSAAGRGGQVAANGGRRGGGGGGGQQGAGQQGGGQGGGGRGPQVQVTDQDCAVITAAYVKHPKEKALVDSARMQMRQGGDRQALNAKIQDLYTKIGVDGPKAGACVRREMQLAGGGGGGGGMGGGGRGGRGGGQRGLTVASGDKPQSQRQTNHPGLAFVAEAGTGPTATYAPRALMLGQGNLDYIEVLSGLNEGDKVVLLNVLALQAQRQQQLDRQKANANPLGGGTQPGRGPGGGGGGGGPPGGGGGRGGF